MREPVATFWARLSQRWAHAVVVSRVVEWVSHWDPAAGRSRRCGGERCELCYLGSPRVLRFVIMVHTGSETSLLELRERHRPLVVLLDGSERGGVGTEIRYRKTGAATNSAVAIEQTGFRAGVHETAIDNLVAKLGLSPIMLSVESTQQDSGDTLPIETEALRKMRSRVNPESS